MNGLNLAKDVDCSQSEPRRNSYAFGLGRTWFSGLNQPPAQSMGEVLIVMAVAQLI